jgi:glycosyltransferase involved in cell wall biosynthesis
VTIYNYIETGAYPRPGRAALRSWNIPEDAFVVGTVATIRPVKGIDILLRAAISCADMKDVYLVIIGPVRDRRVLRLSNDARIRDRVRLLGYREDAQALISGADVFVMPSRSEALSRALLEALFLRVCPVVSDAGGMKEAVRNGIDGLVVPREDVVALANAIRQLHDDRQLVQTFAESAHVRARDHFSAAKMAERMLKLYHRVLDN